MQIDFDEVDDFAVIKYAVVHITQCSGEEHTQAEMKEPLLGGRMGEQPQQEGQGGEGGQDEKSGFSGGEACDGAGIMDGVELQVVFDEDDGFQGGVRIKGIDDIGIADGFDSPLFSGQVGGQAQGGSKPQAQEGREAAPGGKIRGVGSGVC